MMHTVNEYRDFIVKSELPACLTEDQTAPDCYWDASIHGNGIGDSFVVIDGRVEYRHDGYTMPAPTETHIPTPPPLQPSISEHPTTGLEGDLLLAGLLLGASLLIVGVAFGIREHLNKRAAR